MFCVVIVELTSQCVIHLTWWWSTQENLEQTSWCIHGCENKQTTLRSVIEPEEGDNTNAAGICLLVSSSHCLVSDVKHTQVSLVCFQSCSECSELTLAQSLCTLCNKWLCYQCTDVHQHHRPATTSQYQTARPSANQCPDLHQRGASALPATGQGQPVSFYIKRSQLIVLSRSVWQIIIGVCVPLSQMLACLDCTCVLWVSAVVNYA